MERGADVRIRARIPEDLSKRLEAYLAKEGIALTVAVQEALDDYLTGEGY